MIEFRLEDAQDDHQIDVELFLPYVIERLATAPNKEALFELEILGLSESAEDGTLRLRWNTSDVLRVAESIPESTVTEFAAVGVACIVVDQFAGVRITHVAACGDSFDYWVARDGEELGLEVSGTLCGDLHARHREKVEQLLSSPHALNGFVVVVAFEQQQAVLSFHARSHEYDR